MRRQRTVCCRSKCTSSDHHRPYLLAHSPPGMPTNLLPRWLECICRTDARIEASDPPVSVANVRGAIPVSTRAASFAVTDRPAGLSARLTQMAGTVAALAATLALAIPLLKSGLTKWRDWYHVSPMTDYLFESIFRLHILGHRYPFPLPDVLAHIDAVGEVLLPLLLIAGLARRFSALALLVMIGVIKRTDPSCSADFHRPWAALALRAGQRRSETAVDGERAGEHLREWWTTVRHRPHPSIGRVKMRSLATPLERAIRASAMRQPHRSGTSRSRSHGSLALNRWMSN